jgi:hypothetical protein
MLLLILQASELNPCAVNVQVLKSAYDERRLTSSRLRLFLRPRYSYIGPSICGKLSPIKDGEALSRS